jgi:GntR family transcriptional regulator / MocR family aminotransferase
VLVALDRTGVSPLHSQLEAQLRAAIRSGQLAPGTRLPSTRTLAGDLSITRGVVVEAYEQLTAEGYLVARRGSGTVVAPGASGEPSPSAREISAAPPARFSVRPMIPPSRPAHPDALGAAGRPGSVARKAAQRPQVRFDFRYGAPDLSAFPRRAWLAAVREALAEAPDDALNYGDPRGTPWLREELARYLNRTRGTLLTPDVILTTSGTVQAMALICRSLRSRGARRIAVEDPGWPAQPEAARRAGLDPVPVPVDADGIDVERLAALDPDAVFVTPAHQFPTGGVLAPERRSALVAWAEDRGALVFEDDYDAEYRYDRDPVGSLQGLMPERVAYAGSVSKTLAPGLRLAWLGAPAWLVSDLAAEQRADHRQGPVLDELALAGLLARGEFDRHVRRTRRRYRDRRDALVRAVARHLPEARLAGVAAGLHALLELPPGVDEERAAAAARERGIGLAALSELRSGASESPPALLLSYGAVHESAIDRGMRELARAIAPAPARRARRAAAVS